MSLRCTWCRVFWRSKQGIDQTRRLGVMTDNFGRSMIISITGCISALCWTSYQTLGFCRAKVFRTSSGTLSWVRCCWLSIAKESRSSRWAFLAMRSQFRRLIIPWLLRHLTIHHSILQDNYSPRRCNQLFLASRLNRIEHSPGEREVGIDFDHIDIGCWLLPQVSEGAQSCRRGWSP